MTKSIPRTTGAAAPHPPTDSTSESATSKSNTPESSDNLKIVIQVHGLSLVIGIQAPDCDPHLAAVEMVEDPATTPLHQIGALLPQMVEDARSRWRAQQRFPTHQRPVPPPSPPRTVAKPGVKPAPKPVAAPKPSPGRQAEHGTAQPGMFQ